MKATATTLTTALLLLAATGCASSGTVGSGSPHGDAPGSGGGGVAASGAGGDHVATAKTAVEVFLAAVQKGDPAGITAATCQDMQDQVLGNLKGLTLQSYSTSVPYTMEDHWVVPTTFQVTVNGTPLQGKVEYQVVKDGGVFQRCGLDGPPTSGPRGAPGLAPAPQ
jgi:hypothetical protein